MSQDLSLKMTGLLFRTSKALIQNLNRNRPLNEQEI